jgi:hypothetical protein
MGLKLVRIGDGLSSPWGGVVALRRNQDVVAIASISHSPALAPFEILSLRLRLMPIGRILAAALALG